MRFLAHQTQNLGAALGYDLAFFLDARGVHVVLSVAEKDPRLSHRLGNPLDAFGKLVQHLFFVGLVAVELIAGTFRAETARQRLLADNPLARCHCCQNTLFVSVRRRADVQHVDVAQHGLHIVVGFNAVLFAELAASLLSHRSHPSQFHIQTVHAG